MKILLIHQYYLEDEDDGGSRFNDMVKLWDEKGHSITILTGMMHAHATEKRPEYKGRFLYKKTKNNIVIWRCHVSSLYNSNFLGRLWGYLSFVISSSWAGLIKTKSDFDLILVTSPPLFVGITSLFLSIVKRVPYVFEVRDLWPESAIETGIVTNGIVIRLSYWFERLLYKRASLINVLTPAFRDVLVNKKNVPEEKIIFIPNASNFDLSDKVLNYIDREGARKRWGFEDKFVIIYVGAHGVANHLIQLLDVAELLKDTNVLFLFLGRGMQKPFLVNEARIRELNNVRFLDPVPRDIVFEYIVSADMGVSVLKKVEVFKTIYSNKTFDYMACKKPILMLIDGASRELVENADCGIYVEPEKSIEIAAAIRKVLSMREDAIVKGENGYKYAKAHFDRSILAEEYINHLMRQFNVKL